MGEQRRPEFREQLWKQSTPVVRTLVDRTILDAASTSGIWGTVLKTVDEVRASSAVLANDAVLQFPMLAGAKYTIRIRVWFDTTAAADFQWALTGPALNSARITRKSIVPAAAALSGINVDTNYTTAQALVGAGTTGGYIEVDATIRPSANGTFTFQWAQNTSDAGNTAVLAGSYIDYVTN